MTFDPNWDTVWGCIGSTAAAVAAVFGYSKTRPKVEDRVLEKIKPYLTEIKDEVKVNSARVNELSQRVSHVEGRFAERRERS